MRRLTVEMGSTGVPRAHPVTLAKAATVAASLQATVEPTFGPMGGDVIMTNDANQIILTNSGQLILEMVSVSHPVGAFLVHAVQAHTSKTGDGTVAMLAMITGGLQKAAELCGDSTGGGTAAGQYGERRVKLAAGLASLSGGGGRPLAPPPEPCLFTHQSYAPQLVCFKGASHHQ